MLSRAEALHREDPDAAGERAPGRKTLQLSRYGSFENSSFNCGGSGYCLGLVGNDVPVWYIPATDGTYPWGLQSGAFGAGPTPYGNQWFVLGEVNTGTDYTIQQTLNGMTPGQTYNLSFAIASEVGCCAVGEVNFLSGSSTPSQMFTALASGPYWQTATWSTQSMNFVASSSSVTIQFEDLAAQYSSGYDLGLDNVVVTGATTVPEPASLLLLGSGLLGIGGLARRRLKKK